MLFLGNMGYDPVYASNNRRYVNQVGLDRAGFLLVSINARILLVILQVPKLVCPTCLVGRQKS
jgi:hypothetical protein